MTPRLSGAQGSFLSFSVFSTSTSNLPNQAANLYGQNCARLCLLLSLVAPTASRYIIDVQPILAE